MIYVAPDELAETRGSVKIANSNVEFVAASKVSPNGEGVIEIDVLRDGISVQHQTLHARALESGQFTGDPITISLKDADIQEVMQKFSKIAGLTIVMPPDAHETVTINYVQMPWDEALHRVIIDAGYTYRVAGKKIIVTK